MYTWWIEAFHNQYICTTEGRLSHFIPQLPNNDVTREGTRPHLEVALPRPDGEEVKECSEGVFAQAQPHHDTARLVAPGGRDGDLQHLTGVQRLQRGSTRTEVTHVQRPV